jgi:rsbT antagonist protein RsbS
MSMVAERAVERIPILKMRNYLLVSIQVDLHDRMALALQDELSNRIVQDQAKGVIIDISALEIVDSFIGRVLGSISGISKLLDAETVLVGMRPAVAITLVELGVRLGHIKTALNLEDGMSLLDKSALENNSRNGSSKRKAADNRQHGNSSHRM